MIFLFYGKNDFLISRRKREIKNSSRKKNSSLEIKEFDFLEDHFPDFVNYLKEQSIFSPKKLIFLTNYSKIAAGEKAENFLEANLKKLAEDKKTWLVFLEGEGKNKTINFLLKNGAKAYKLEPFSKDNRALFFKYLRKMANDFGREITNRALYVLVDFFGYDPWLIEGEIEKLLLYSEEKTIDERTVEENSSPQYISNEIFLLAEKILEKDKKKAVFLLEKLLFLGQEPRLIFNMLLSQMSNFLRVKYLPYSQLGFKPFFIKKAKPLVNKFSDEDMLRVYKLLARKDFSIKTTKLTYKEALMDFFRQI